jgi:hypothetical protein
MHVNRCSNSWRQQFDQKEVEKILKYKDHIIESQCILNVKAKVIPEIIGATGTISKSLRQYLSNITKMHEIKELQKVSYCALHTNYGKS